MIEKGTALTTGGSTIGGFFGVFCPACVPLVGSFFSAIGLGALLNFTLLHLLTVLFLLLGVFGLYLNFRIHKKWYFLGIGLFISFLIYGARYVVELTPLLYASGALLMTNIFLDYKALSNAKKCNRCDVKQQW